MCYCLVVVVVAVCLFVCFVCFAVVVVLWFCVPKLWIEFEPWFEKKKKDLWYNDSWNELWNE